MLSLLVAGQLVVAAEPAFAADPDLSEQSRMGMFGGVQVRLPFGGQRTERVRAGLALAPMMRSQRIGGATATRVGEGLELNLTERRPELRFAGTRLDRLGVRPDGQGPDGRRLGVSTLGWVGIGLGAVVLVAGGYALWLTEALDCDPGDDCS
jgi:hypothetical protein